MFSTGHLLWIAVSTVLIAAALVICLKKKPPLRKVILVCLILGLISEAIKIYSVIEIVPRVDAVIEGGKIVWQAANDYTPVMGKEHLPIELCSLQLIFMFLALVLKDEKKRHLVYALMFPTAVIGGLIGIVLASITAYFETVADYFLSPRVWQFFIYHAMVVFLGLYLGISKDAGLTFRDWKKAIIALVILDIPTFYINSLLASEVYVADKIIGVTHRINYFSSYVNPLGLVLTEKWQWLVYLAVRAVITVSVVLLIYLPLLKRKPQEAVKE